VSLSRPRWVVPIASFISNLASTDATTILTPRLKACVELDPNYASIQFGFRQMSDGLQGITSIVVFTKAKAARCLVNSIQTHMDLPHWAYL
jgi:hypothetical protein